jgi:hypothetical protein
LKFKIKSRLEYHKVGEIFDTKKGGKVRMDRFKDDKFTVADAKPGDLHLSLEESVHFVMYAKEFREKYFQVLEYKDPIAEYKRLHAELMAEPNLTFPEYMDKNAALKSAIVVYLKMKKVPGKERTKINKQMQTLDYRRTREFLYARDPRCGICGKPIESLKEVSIDHIVPKFAGGINHWSNKQIAHKECNNKIKNKSDWEKYGKKVLDEAQG